MYGARNQIPQKIPIINRKTGDRGYIWSNVVSGMQQASQIGVYVTYYMDAMHMHLTPIEDIYINYGNLPHGPPPREPRFGGSRL